MTFSPVQIAALDAPLDRRNVKKNPRGYDYVEGWHAIAEANRIFGFDGWHREAVMLNPVAEAYKTGDNWRVGYICKVRITVTAGLAVTDGPVIIREGVGYGSGIGKDLNDAHESAAKEAETDAMKRALMTFGNPFGLALYDKTQAQVADTPAEPPPPRIDPAAFLDRWQRMLAQAVDMTALEKVKADTLAERADVKAQDADTTAKINDAFKRRRAELAAANTNTPGNHQTAISAG